MSKNKYILFTLLTNAKFPVLGGEQLKARALLANIKTGLTLAPSDAGSAPELGVEPGHRAADELVAFFNRCLPP